MSTGGLGVIAILGFVGVGLLFVLFVGVIVGILTRNDKKRKMQQKEADPNAHLTQMGVGSGFNTPYRSGKIYVTMSEMTKELKQAKEILEKTDVTFCAVTADGTITSDLRGITPMLQMLTGDKESLRNSCVADKVIGKAAAFLLIKGGAAKLYAKVISHHALELLEKSGIKVTYDKCVPYIINRKGDGMCPMEECVLDTEDVEEAYRLLCEKTKIRNS